MSSKARRRASAGSGSKGPTASPKTSSATRSRAPFTSSSSAPASTTPSRSRKTSRRCGTSTSPRGSSTCGVGRRLVWSPDLSELEIDFLIEEGPRYVVDKVVFQHNTGVSEAELQAAAQAAGGQGLRQRASQRDIQAKSSRPTATCTTATSTCPTAPTRTTCRSNAKNIFRKQAGRVSPGLRHPRRQALPAREHLRQGQLPQPGQAGLPRVPRFRRPAMYSTPARWTTPPTGSASCPISRR